MKTTTVCVFGEVLFDVFSEQQRVLGGAPFNVAWHLNAFGARPHLISRVGDDKDGQQIRSVMQQHDFDSSALQIDPEHATGKVKVSIVDDEPEYDIVFPSAYDFIQADTQLDNISLLYHGTLALRNQASEAALNAIYATKPATVFLDVNLRAPWWEKDKVLSWMHKADWLKLNADELEQLYPSTQALPQRINSLMEQYQLKGVVLTHGSKGASVYSQQDEVAKVAPQPSNKVVDTVGAGDAFTSVFIFGMLNDWPIDQTLQRAQQFASCIVEQRGAIISDKAVYRDLLQQWGVL